MAVYNINVNNLRKSIPSLCAGDEVMLSGTVYTARDAAHKRLVALIERGADLPFDLKDAVIYYAGPTPEREGRPIGSCGPTTSTRMDGFAPLLLDMGLAGMIGKGERKQPVTDAIVRNAAIYFCAIGGAGALAAKCITSCEIIAFEELGCESIKRLEIKDFPLIVGIDCRGEKIFSNN